jgi:lipid-binding SYLF domain-containing protein
MLSRANVFGLLAGFALTLGAGPAPAAAEREEAKLLTAPKVVEELQATRDQYIPDRLLERAYGIAVVPDVGKVAFIGGGRYGTGVLVVRGQNGNFSSPIFVRLAGGSFGLQWGVQSADIVLVFTTKAGIEGITDGKMTLGGDASVAAGPVGRAASAGTDSNFSAEIYSYSRARGLFAGIALDGTALTIDKGANARYYDKHSAPVQDIIDGKLTSSDEAAQKFLATIGRSTGAAAASPSAASSSPAPAPQSESPQPAPPPSGGAQTFPMEDPAPGEEPK